MASPVTIEAEGNRTIQPISADTNEGSGEIVQRAYFSRDAFQETFSLFISIKAFKVERILLTFTT